MVVGTPSATSCSFLMSPEMLDQHDVTAQLIQLRIHEAFSIGCDGTAIVTDAARSREAGLLQAPRSEIVEEQLGGLVDAIESGSTRFHLEDVNAVGRHGPVAVAHGGNQVLLQAAVHRNAS